MNINIDKLQIETIDYIDGRGLRNPKKGLRDLKKLVSVTFSTNSILLDVMKNLLKYNKYIKVRYFKGKNTDTLFINLIGVNHALIKLFNKYNDILTGITYKEQALLNYIRGHSYITKKYNLDNHPTKNEYGVYELTNPTDTYNDYNNIHNQFIFKNKRIVYNKTKKEMDTISKTLSRCCEIITDFKLSDIKINPTSDTLFIDVFNYRLNCCKFRLTNNYNRVSKTYKDFPEFIKYMVFYGATHHNNQRFWEKVKRELY